MWKTWRYKGLAGILAPSVVCTETELPDFLKGSGSHQYVANKFIEDRIGQHHMKHKNLHFVTVMDGHGGPQAAEFLTREIPEIFLQKIAKEKSIVSALKSTFHEADQTWFNLVHPAYQLGFTAPIKVGACALAIVVDEKEITVASVGDCKCVLARDDGSSMDLNVERNINNEQEQERLRLLHPGEEDIVRCKRSWQDTVLMKTLYAGCYVKGRLQPTKSFGDFHLKDSRVILDHERQRPFLDPTTPKSFPYIDVDPDISVTKRSKSDRFLIAATDGLWDQFTSAEAVIIVEAALRAGLTPDRASEELVEAALRNAAKNRNLKIEDMKAIPPGSTRRGIHDDISVCILLL